MRIGFDGKRYFNNKTGLGNYSRSLVHLLAENFPNDEFVLFTEKPAETEVQLPNLRVFAPEKKGLFWRSFGMAKDAQKLGIDVFHGLSNEIPFGLKKRGIKAVVTIHDVIFKRYPGLYPVFDRFIYHLKTKMALKNADKVLATSKATADDLDAYYGYSSSKSNIIYQPVIKEFYALHSPKSDFSTPYFIYLSSFTGRKNHAILVEAFAKIQKTCDWNLLLVGAAGPTEQTVRNFIYNEKLDNRITILTNLDQKDLVGIMQGASGFLYPSFFEGFGIPLAEAAVCNLPMGVSDIPVFKELAEDAALYFHPNKADEIADVMMQLFRGELNPKMAEKRPKILEKINPNFIAQELMRVYKG